jgi:hypothetical protein
MFIVSVMENMVSWLKRFFCYLSIIFGPFQGEKLDCGKNYSVALTG